MKTTMRTFRLPASMAVEASYVMTMVIVALAVLIRAAYGQCVKTTEVMNLHRTVEQLRYREEPEEEQRLSRGRAWRDADKAGGFVNAEMWEKEITAGVHEPEEFLRMLSIFEPEEGGGGDGSTVYQGDEAELPGDRHERGQGTGL